MQDKVTNNKEKKISRYKPYKHSKHIGISAEKWKFNKQPNENSRIEKYSYLK